MNKTPSATTKDSTKSKTVTPLFRVQVKANRDVIYRVRNGENREYLVTIHPDGTSGCTQCANDEPCPSSKSGRKCYHIKHSLMLEEARTERATHKMWLESLVTETDELPNSVATVSRKCPVNVPPDTYRVGSINVTSFADLPIDEQEFRDDPLQTEQWAKEALMREAYVLEFDPCYAC